jgi:hypothetical protein
MSISLEQINVIARAVIAETRHDVETVSVLSTDGGSERVELLITITGCHKDPCRLLLNLTRADGAEFESELREKVREALVSHVN